jgi:hypothetical protein
MNGRRTERSPSPAARMGSNWIVVRSILVCDPIVPEAYFGQW